VTSPIELMAYITTGAEHGGFDLVQTTWKTLLPAADFDRAWRVVLHNGVLAGATKPTVELGNVGPALSTFAAANPEPAMSGAMEAVFLDDVSVYDGRYCFNGWLQETPDSFTKLTWDNAAVMNAVTAKRLGVKITMDELGAPACDMVTVTVGGATATLPVLALPGVADDTVLLSQGFGRDQAGVVHRAGGSMRRMASLRQQHFADERVPQPLDLVVGPGLSRSGSTVAIVIAAPTGGDEQAEGDGQDVHPADSKSQVGWHIGSDYRLMVPQIPIRALPPAVSWDSGSSITMDKTLKPAT
jgi:molybdopterin-containing oxidoreductase family iron-sulfur binding subunit